MSNKIHRARRRRRPSAPDHHLPFPLSFPTNPRNNSAHIPLLQRLVQAPANKPPPVRRERNTVHAIPMSPQLFQQLPRHDVPNTHDSVKRPGSDVPRVGGDGDGGDARVQVG